MPGFLDFLRHIWFKSFSLCKVSLQFRSFKKKCPDLSCIIFKKNYRWIVAWCTWTFEIIVLQFQISLLRIWRWKRILWLISCNNLKKIKISKSRIHLNIHLFFIFSDILQKLFSFQLLSKINSKKICPEKDIFGKAFFLMNNTFGDITCLLKSLFGCLPSTRNTIERRQIRR